jgi:hypothetical protein
MHRSTHAHVARTDARTLPPPQVSLFIVALVLSLVLTNIVNHW